MIKLHELIIALFYLLIRQVEPSTLCSIKILSSAEYLNSSLSCPNVSKIFDFSNFDSTVNGAATMSLGFWYYVDPAAIYDNNAIFQLMALNQSNAAADLFKMAVFYNTSSRNLVMITGSNENFLGPNLSTTVNVQPGYWYHFYFSVDYTNKLSYISFYDSNTTVTTTGSFTFASVNPSFTTNLKLILGNDYASSSSICSASGKFEDIFYVVNYRGDPSQILYRNGLTTNLIIDYSFSENCGQVIIDKSTSNLNGILGNTVSIESQDPVWDQTSNGIKFNQSTQRIVVPTFNFLDTFQSFGVYINPTISSYNCTSVYLFQRLQTNSVIRFGIYVDSSTQNIGVTINGVTYLSNMKFNSANWQCITGCNMAYSFANTVCLSFQTLPTCSSSTFSTSAGCLSCDYRCQICEDYSNKLCSTCRSGFQFISNQTCDCGVGTFSALSSGYASCPSCATGCFECSGSATNCISCNPGYYLSGTSCVACVAQCRTCFGSTSASCLTCSASNYLQTDYKTCSATCPANTATDTTLNICRNWINVIKDLDYDIAIWNTSLWTITPSFNPTKLPQYTQCGSVALFGGLDKFEDVVSINRTFILPAHTRLFLYASVYMINSGWTSGTQFQVYLDQSLVLTLYPNNTASGTNLCGKGTNDSLFSISVFYEHSASTLDVKFSQVSLATKKSFAVRNVTILTKSCFFSCLDCVGSNFDDCLTCQPGNFTLVNNSKTQCLSDCPTAYFKNSTALTCIGCSVTNCVNCSTNRMNCTQCASNTYLLFGLCYSICPFGYGKNDTTGTCDPCRVTSCNNCSYDPFTCISCLTNFYALNNTCYATCPIYYANNATLGICRQCSASCLQCAGDGTNCTKCDSTSFLLNTICYTPCPNGFFGNTTLGRCLNCNVASCLDCSTDIRNCSLCAANTYLLWGICYSTCPLGYGRNTTLGICSPCTNSLCSNCSSDPTNCTDCSTNSLLFFGSCGTSCPGYYGANSTLRRCIKCTDQNCLTCNGLGANCTLCNSNTFLYNAACFNPCPIKFTGNSTFGTCIPCNNTLCDNCTSDSLICNKCNAVSYILSGICYSICPRNYYGNITNMTCLSCNSTCAYCTGPAFNDCTICETGLYSLNISSKVQCVATCPQRFSANITTYRCVPCQDTNCLTCTSDGKNCSLCATGTYLLWGSCYTICPLGYGKNDTTGTCNPCVNPFCSNCSSDPTNCTICSNNYFLLWGNCSSTCPAFYGTNTTFKACIRCTDFNCTVCNVNPNNCTKCTPDTYLLNLTCYFNCPVTYTNNATYGTCIRCLDPNCNYCTTNSLTCLTCNSMTYILNGTCYTRCPGGYWGNTTDMTCRLCDPTCQNCTGPTTSNCTSCVPGAFRWLYLNQCVTSCPIVGFYPNNVTLNCSRCDPTCYTCSDGRTNNCTSCIAPRYLITSTCSLTCPMTYYQNATYNICQPCLDPYCQWCNTTFTLCDQCLVTTQMNLYLSNCIPTCPVGLYSDPLSHVCKPCNSTCYGCSGPTSQNCTLCSGTKYLFNLTNECVDICPVRYYNNVTDNKCYPCIKNCFLCGDDTNLNCTACEIGLNYYPDLYNGCWFATCGDGRKLGPLEECDDGNTVNGDGCDSTCKIERGWVCSEPNNRTLLSVCNTVCGDSIFIAKTEACDDGNPNNGDGCNSLCTVESGYFCYGGSLFSKSICTCEPINGTVAFSSNWESLIITYPKQLDSPPFANPSSTLCDNLFDTATIALFGSGYSCLITSNQIQIDLGMNHLMDLKKSLTILPASFNATVCPQNPKSIELFLANFQPGDYNHRPSFVVNSSDTYRLCKPNSFNLISITNYGKRGYTVAWDIQMSNPADSLILSNAKISLATSVNSLQTTFQPLVLLSTNTYTISASITPYWGTPGTFFKLVTPDVTVQVRSPNPKVVCVDPSMLSFQTIPSQRNGILITFNRPIVNTTTELLNVLLLSIIPSYSRSDFEPILTKVDADTFNLTLIYKKSVFQKQLQIQINDPSQLQDIYGNSYIGRNTYTMNLLNFDVFSSSQLSLSQSASGAAAASLMAAIIPIILFASGPLILSFLNGAQVVNYLRFINIYYPINVESFLRAFNNINFSFLPGLADFGIDFPIIDQIAPFRFDSLNVSTMFLINAGGIIIMAIATFLAHKIIRILAQIRIPIRQVRKAIVTLDAFMIYNGYILVMDSTYYQQSLSIFLQVTNMSTENNWNILSFSLCFVEMILYFSYFIFVYKMASKMDMIYYTKHSAIMKKLKVLFSEYDCLQNRRARYFAIIICLRKMVHCIFLIFCHDNFWIEITLLVAMNISFLLALCIIRPYFSLSRLKRELFIEFSYMMCHIFVGLMKFYESDSDLKYNIGWGVVGGSMCIIGVYLLDGVQMMIGKAKQLLKKIRNILIKKLKIKGARIAPTNPYVYNSESSVPKKANPKKFRLPRNDLRRQITPFHL